MGVTFLVVVDEVTRETAGVEGALDEAVGRDWRTAGLQLTYKADNVFTWTHWSWHTCSWLLENLDLARPDEHTVFRLTAEVPFSLHRAVILAYCL